MGRLQAIWTAIAGVVSALVPYLARPKELLVAGIDRVRRSFVALVGSPAVWVASLAIGLGCYWGGYMMAANGKRALRTEVSTLEQTVERVRAAEALARRDEAKLRADLAAEKAIAMIEAKGPAATRREPVAAVARRPVPRAKPTVPASGGAPAWAPWR
jgi:hypothetical protein